MKCKKCGATWKAGNLAPKIDTCPICDIDFSYFPEDREFETVVEVLQFLIIKNGVGYWRNNKGINGYLNDYFPEKIETRNGIKFLLEKELDEKIIEWYVNNPKREEVVQVLKNTQFHGDIDTFADGLMFLSGADKSEGTDIESPFFYKDYAKTCSNVAYRVKALEKAVAHGADEKTALELANIKMCISSNDGLDNLRKLAEQGNIDALLQLAKMYEKGEVIERDYSKEVEYLNKAALQNSAEGLFQLGRLYLLGWGVEKSKEKAVSLFERASEQNHAKANYQLYSVYYDGQTNLEQQAINKLQNAAKSGYVPAMYEYALHLLYGEQIAEDVRMAITILEQCAMQGSNEAIEKLRYIYSIGYKVPRDKLKALEWQDKLIGE